MNDFIDPNIDDIALWRAIILQGKNSASFKFAMAKALLELVNKEKTKVTLNELAVPYANAIQEHIKKVDKQGTANSSEFLEAHRNYASGINTDYNELIKKTVQHGFKNVLDAFHIVNTKPVSASFFKVEGERRSKFITVTDELLALKDQNQFKNLGYEVESRWNLVERSWELGISSNLLLIKHDEKEGTLFIESDKIKRVDVTSSKNTLNAYQEGHCFFCKREIILDNSDPEKLTHVDHFFPHTLMDKNPELNLNGIWNLVLACNTCNNGSDGKFALIPKLKYLDRLHNRNEFFVKAFRPLNETIMCQTGKEATSRHSFLQKMNEYAVKEQIHKWAPKEEYQWEFRKV